MATRVTVGWTGTLSPAHAVMNSVRSDKNRIKPSFDVLVGIKFSVAVGKVSGRWSGVAAGHFEKPRVRRCGDVNRLTKVEHVEFQFDGGFVSRMVGVVSLDGARHLVHKAIGARPEFEFGIVNLFELTLDILIVGNSAKVIREAIVLGSPNVARLPVKSFATGDVKSAFAEIIRVEVSQQRLGRGHVAGDVAKFRWEFVPRESGQRRVCPPSP